MRILLSFVGGSGHFEPLVPVARAAATAGHTVAITGRPGILPSIEAAGFTAFPSGADSGDSSKRYPLAAVNMTHEYDVLRTYFAGRAARERAADIVRLCAEWQPDVIVCDEIDFGAMIAAEHLGLPYASVLVIAAGSFVRKDVVADALNDMRAEYGLPPDPELSALSRYLVLSPFPPGYRDPAFPLPPTAYSIRPAQQAATNAHAPAWLDSLDANPTVYFTLGTVFDRESGDLFSRVLAGLRELPINLIVTVGRYIDPAEFGEQPEHVHIEQYVPQGLILPRCNAVVSHGGSGSVAGALAHGLPSVLLPMGADQPLNAGRCEALGVGRALDVMTATPDDVRDAVRAVLNEPSYREAAQRLRAEVAALPDTASAVPILERLVAEKHRTIS